MKLLLEEFLFEDAEVENGEEMPDNGAGEDSSVAGDELDLDGIDFNDDGSSEADTQTPEEGDEPMKDPSSEPIKEPQTTYKVSYQLGSHSNWSRIDASSEEEAKDTVEKYITQKYPTRDYEFISIEEFEDIEESMSLTEAMDGDYSLKFKEYAKKLSDNDESLLGLVDDLILYANEEDLKDLWNKKEYDKRLSEDLTTDAQPIETGAAVGMASVVGDLIRGEYETINEYNSAMATAEVEGFGDAVSILADIQAEENRHIGQLQTLMKMFDPNAGQVDEGQLEGESQLGETQNTAEEITESLVDLDSMTDREYSRLTKIVRKFHKISPKEFLERCYDGVIKPKYVEDTDNIPGYNESIDISSSDLSQGTGNVMVYTVLSPVDGQLYGYVSY